MPHYLITIILKSGERLSGIRFSEEYNIDKAWQLFESKAVANTPQLKTFDLVMISKRSVVYKRWLADQQKKKTQGWILMHLEIYLGRVIRNATILLLTIKKNLIP